MIVYGGTKRQIEEQLVCEHEFSESVYIDIISRYRKCGKCLCMDRDCQNEQEYYRLVDEANKMMDDL